MSWLIPMAPPTEYDYIGYEYQGACVLLSPSVAVTQPRNSGPYGDKLFAYHVDVSTGDWFRLGYIEE